MFVIMFLPPPPPPPHATAPSYSHSLLPSHSHFVLFVSSVTFSSRHPSQATLTRRQGCLSGSVRCPLFSLAWCPQSSNPPSSSQLFSFLPHDSLHKQPGCAT